MAKKKDKKQIPETSKTPEDFNINIDEFGEIKTSMTIDEINDFLNKNVDDKKLKGHIGLTEEE